MCWGCPPPNPPLSCQPALRDLLCPPQAAAHEPPRSPEVALCFANRSAALFHLGHFEVSRGSGCQPCNQSVPLCSRSGEQGKEEPKQNLRYCLTVFAQRASGRCSRKPRSDVSLVVRMRDCRSVGNRILGCISRGVAAGRGRGLSPSALPL